MASLDGTSQKANEKGADQSVHLSRVVPALLFANHQRKVFSGQGPIRILLISVWVCCGLITIFLTTVFLKKYLIPYESGREKTCLREFANNKGAG